MNTFYHVKRDTRASGNPVSVLLSGVLLLVMMGLPACHTAGDEQALQAEARQLAAGMDSLSCTLRQLEDSTRVLWDGVNAALDENLPANMPPIERKNMLAVRNTQLIEMFQNYDSLGESVHRLVREAGVKDEAIAQRVIALKHKQDAQELLFAAFLEKAAGMDAEALKKIERDFEGARKAKHCR